jgi:DNA-binding MarR family transcriptional regulator
MTLKQLNGKKSRTPSGLADGPHLEDFIAFRISVLAHVMGRIVELSHGRRHGISLRQWRVLAFVGSAGTLSAQEVARRSPLDKSQVSRAVAELAALGLLRSDGVPDDRRRKELALTAAGRRMFERLLALGRERNARYASVLTRAERVVLDRALRKITEEARRMARELQSLEGERPGGRRGAAAQASRARRAR